MLAERFCIITETFHGTWKTREKLDSSTVHSSMTRSEISTGIRKSCVFKPCVCGLETYILLTTRNINWNKNSLSRGSIL